MFELLGMLVDNQMILFGIMFFTKKILQDGQPDNFGGLLRFPDLPSKHHSARHLSSQPQGELRGEGPRDTTLEDALNMEKKHIVSKTSNIIMGRWVIQFLLQTYVFWSSIYWIEYGSNMEVVLECFRYGPD